MLTDKYITMRHIAILCVSLLAVMALGGCKTNENNYRAAYEMARQKERSGIDSTVYEKIRKEARPSTVDVDGRRLPALDVAVRVTSGLGEPSQLKSYCVAVAQFKQLFNAKAMTTRLRQGGYDAFVVETREPLYYVLAGSSDTASDAAMLLERVAADKSIVLRDPYPFILRPVGRAVQRAAAR